MERAELMNRLVFVLVFLIVALGGIAGLLGSRGTAKPLSAKRRPMAVPVKSPESSAHPVFPPLRLPPGVTAVPGRGGGWECSGKLDANFVSARGRLSAWFQNQLWHPQKQITLDESLEPRVLLTFSRERVELIVMLWKISTDQTGFSCRRGLQEEPTGGMLP